MLGVRQALLRAQARADELSDRLRRGPARRIVIDPNRDVEQYLRGGAGRRRADHARHRDAHPRRLRVRQPRAGARAPARRCYLSDEGDADWKYEFARDRNVVRDQARRSHHDRQRPRSKSLHTPGHTPEHLTFLVTDARRRERADWRGDRRLHLRRRRRPARPARARRQHHGHDGGGARALYRSLQRSARGRTGCRSGRATAPARRAARASARFRRARSATSSASTGRSRPRREDEFVASVLAGQPEPPKYFAEMKRINKEGPRVARRISDARRTSTRACCRALLVERRARRSTRGARREFAVGHVPGTINIPLNAAFTTWAGWLVPYDADFYLIVDEPAARGAIDARRARSRDDRPRSGRPGTSTPSAIDAWAIAGRPLGTIPQLESQDLAAVARHRRRHARRRAQRGRMGHGPHRRRAAHPARLPRRSTRRDPAREADRRAVPVGGRARRSAPASSAHAAFDRVINFPGGMAAWVERTDCPVSHRWPKNAPLLKPRRRRSASARSCGTCSSARGPDCTTPEQGDETWTYVKQRMKELEHHRAGRPGVPHAGATACGSARAARSRSSIPEGAWYRNVTPENAERIIQEHVIGGRIVEDLCFARNPLFLR